MHIQQDPYATYKLLRRAFEERGYSYTEEDRDGRLYVTFTSPLGKEWCFHAARIKYPFTSKRVRELSIHKERAYDFVSSLGVSVPFTRYVARNETPSAEEVAQLLGQYSKLIVKPANSSLSRGLTLDIQTDGQLYDALEYARDFKSDVLIQEQVEGEEVRFIVMRGKVRAALLRQTARVVGDGVSTVASLVRAENEQRKTLVFPLIRYPQLTKSMIDPSYFNDQTVLGAGEVKELNRATMIKNGCSVYNVVDRVHPSYIALVEQLASSVDTDFIVADLFLRDFTKPRREGDYWFIEFNTSPVLKLCYGCRDGRMFDVIPLLVDAIDLWLHRKREA